MRFSATFQISLQKPPVLAFFSRSGYRSSDPADLPRPLDYRTIEGKTGLPKVLDGVGVRHAALIGHIDDATVAAIYAGSIVD